MAYLSVMLNTFVFSSIIDPLSVTIVNGKCECSVVISFTISAVCPAVASITGYANSFLEKPSIAVVKQLYPPLSYRLGNRSTGIVSSGPKYHSGKQVSSVVIGAYGVLFN